MMRNASFVRKIIYIVCIVLLLIPLSMIASPSTRDKNNEIKNPGGVLAKLRDENRLSQAKLGDIDPTSESMKLATLGLRPFAISMLWNQAHEYERRHNWDRYTATLNQLMKLQPNFINVWEFQAHTLAYNTSREFDDYEDRYAWVKKGINFLISGIGYNRYDHRMIDNIGRYFSMKIGQSDEKWLYRRLLRKDKDFHDELRSEIDVDAADKRGDGPDNYLIAREWYTRSENMVEKQNLPLYSSGALIFYLNVPKQARNFAKAIEVEFEPDEFARNAWKNAGEDWKAFGEKSIRTTIGPRIQMNARRDDAEDVTAMKEQFEEMVEPGARARMEEARIAERTPEEKIFMTLPLSELSDDELHKVDMRKRIEEVRRSELFEYVPADLRAKAERLSKDIDLVEERLLITDKYRSVSNYLFWDVVCAAEITDEGLGGRNGLFHGWRLVDNQPYTEYKTDPVTNELVLDPETGEKIEVPGAVDEFRRSFDSWAEVFKKFPSTDKNPHHLDNGVYNADLETALLTYYRLLGSPGQWPEDMPLQKLIDRGVGMSGVDLPTTPVLKQMFPERYEDSELDSKSDDEEAGKEVKEKEATEKNDSGDGDEKNGDKEDADKKDADADMKKADEKAENSSKDDGKEEGDNEKDAEKENSEDEPDKSVDKEKEAKKDAESASEKSKEEVSEKSEKKSGESAEKKDADAESESTETKSADEKKPEASKEDKKSEDKKPEAQEPKEKEPEDTE